MSIPSSDSTAITAPAAALTTAATSQSSSATVAARLPNVVLFGTGEYTTGYVAGASSTSDKPVSEYVMYGKGASDDSGSDSGAAASAMQRI